MDRGGADYGMKRFEQLRRVVPVLRSLLRGEAVGWDEIASATGYGEKQARRLWRALRDGLKLEVVADGRRRLVRFAAIDLVPAPDLRQLVAMEFASSAMQVFLGTGVFESWSEYSAKLRSLASRRTVERLQRLRPALIFKRGPHTRLEQCKDIFEDLQDALILRKRVLLQYCSTGTGTRAGYRVEPWALVCHLGSIYLLGRLIDSSEERLWKLEAIEELKILRSEPYRYPSEQEFDPETYFDKYYGVYIDRVPAPQKVELMFRGRISGFVKVTDWPTTIRKAETPDGLLLELFACLTPELERMVLGFGEECQVVAPLELRDRIARRLNAAAKQY